MVRFENCDKDHSSSDVRSVIKPFIQEGLFYSQRGVDFWWWYVIIEYGKEKRGKN